MPGIRNSAKAVSCPLFVSDGYFFSHYCLNHYCGAAGITPAAMKGNRFRKASRISG